MPQHAYGWFFVKGRRSIIAGALLFTSVIAKSTMAQEAFVPTAGENELYDSSNLLDLETLKEKILGRYAHYDVVAYRQKFFGGEMKTRVITYGITEFFRDDAGKVISRSRYCHASHLSNLPFQSTVPDAFTRAIIPRDAPLSFNRQGNTWLMLRPETPTPIGIHLEDPGEPLPTDPQDPRITDDDQDGKPGVTVFLKLYGFIDTEIYIARREIFAYYLRMSYDGRLFGHVRDRSEQLVIGSPLFFLRSPNSPTQDSDLSQSPILLVPIEQGTDCDQVMAERDLLFPPEVGP